MNTTRTNLARGLVVLAIAASILVSNSVRADFTGNWVGTCQGAYTVLSIPATTINSTSPRSYIPNNLKLAGSNQSVAAGIINTYYYGYRYFHAEISSGITAFFYHDYVTPNDLNQLMAEAIIMDPTFSYYGVSIVTPHNTIGPYYPSANFPVVSPQASLGQASLETNSGSKQPTAALAYNEWYDSSYVGHYQVLPSTADGNGNGDPGSWLLTLYTYPTLIDWYNPPGDPPYNGGTLLDAYNYP
jgi:hypothetical protein